MNSEYEEKQADHSREKRPAGYAGAGRHREITKTG